MTTEEKHTELKELADGAIARLKQLSAPVVRVSGPLTSGGYGYDENLRRFIAAQNKLSDQNYTVFDYVEDEVDIHKLDLAWGYIVEDYHRPILNTQLIKTIFFIPGWQESNIARLEHLYAKELGLTIKGIPEEWLQQ